MHGKRAPVKAKYAILKGQEVCFKVGEYDTSKPLVIDPILVYSTYLGGSNGDFAYAVATDAKGNTYVTGTTGSTDFPFTQGAFQTAIVGGDAFVAKISPDGSKMVYATYLGGKGVEWGNGIAVDASGSAYVVGNTQSSNFPIVKGALSSTYAGGNWGSAFVTKIDPSGSSLVYSTYFPATFGVGIALDADQNAYITGQSARNTQIGRAHV